jgi:hypothetical protein
MDKKKKKEKERDENIKSQRVLFFSSSNPHFLFLVKHLPDHEK